MDIPGQFARALVALWWWGPRPEQLHPHGGYGHRSRAARGYRLAWGAGRVLGWSCIVAAVALLVALGSTLTR